MPDNRKYLNGNSDFLETIPSIHSEEFAGIARKAVINAQQNNEFSILSVTIPFEQLDPLAVLEILGNKDTFQYFWEYPEEKLAIAASRNILKLRADGDSRFNTISDAITHWKKRIFEHSSFGHSLAGVHFLGGFSFFDQVTEPEWQRFGAACFVVPEWTFIRDGELSLLTVNVASHPGTEADALQELVQTQFYAIHSKLLQLTKSKNGCPTSASNVQTRVEEDKLAFEQWTQSINEAQKNINSGVYDKIVLSRKIKVELDRDIEPTRVLNHLRREYPSCYTFLFRPDGKTSFIGSTPERLLSIRSNYILTEGLAGSISRGKTATEDTILEKQLLHSSKDLEEHAYVIRAIENRLALFSDEVNYPAKPGIKKFTNVQHLYTPISAWMNQDYDPFQILDKLHPTPAVGGFPTLEAIDHIPDLEFYDRGWYAGPVGWINSKGRGEFVVAIRSGLIEEKQAYFYAGCGIVEHSDASSEWDETKLKFIPMLTAINHG
jgi:menaquinone-specific isochorismate synthase